MLSCPFRKDRTRIKTWGSCIATSCGVGGRHGSYLVLLWLWCRPAAAALIRLLAWEPPYAVAAALEKAATTTTTTRAASEQLSGCSRQIPILGRSWAQGPSNYDSFILPAPNLMLSLPFEWIACLSSAQFQYLLQDLIQNWPWSMNERSLSVPLLLCISCPQLFRVFY